MREHARTGEPLPDAIANKPELLPGLGVYWRAFKELQTCRAAGFAGTTIPWSIIEQYADAIGARGETREDLHFHVRALDRAFLEWDAKKRRDG